MDCYPGETAIVSCLVLDVQPKSHPKFRVLQFRMDFCQDSSSSIFLTILIFLTRLVSQQVRKHCSNFA